MTQFFADFSGNSRLKKNQQIKDKGSKQNGDTLFGVVSIADVNFVFYPVSSIHFNSLLFAPTSLFVSVSTNITNGVRLHPQTK